MGTACIKNILLSDAQAAARLAVADQVENLRNMHPPPHSGYKEPLNICRKMIDDEVVVIANLETQGIPRAVDGTLYELYCLAVALEEQRMCIAHHKEEAVSMHAKQDYEQEVSIYERALRLDTQDATLLDGYSKAKESLRQQKLANAKAQARVCQEPILIDELADRTKCPHR